MHSALSDGEWLVLDDKAAPGALARAVSLPTHNLISEQDYLLILEQYPFTEFCNYLVRNMIVLAEDDITMFQLFAVAKRFIVVLSQAFVAFPVQGYSNLRRRYFFFSPLVFSALTNYSRKQDGTNHLSVHRDDRGQLGPEHDVRENPPL